ncbi:helix-turn-helix transcriptional regulator [Rhizobium sp. NPDC090275]|uniref:helix-turn-helix transcriptional regulator n=1 Tax=Rhizobium sp. NPDC090275 TaxID=3364498 RepID=UPI00383A86C4
MSKLLNLRTVLDLVPVNERTIARWVKAGRFPAPLKVGRRVMWRLSDLDAFADGGLTPLAPPAPPSPVPLTGIEADAARWAAMFARPASTRSPA